MSATERPDPEQLRQDIARTRAEMGRTVDEIEDRVSPSRIRERQANRIRGRWERARTTVMGEPGPSGTRERVGGMADQASESVQRAPERVEDMTRGNPLAAGMIAFGLGALAGSLLPSSEAERSIAGELREEFETPVRDSLQRSSEEVADHMKDEAQRSMEETKQVAQDAAERTSEQAQRSAEQVRHRA